MIPFIKQTENSNNAPVALFVQNGKSDNSDEKFADIFGRLNSEQCCQKIADKSEKSVDKSTKKEENQELQNNETSSIALFGTEEIQVEDKIQSPQNLSQESQENAPEALTKDGVSEESSATESQKTNSQEFSSIFLGNIRLNEGKLVKAQEEQVVANEDTSLLSKMQNLPDENLYSAEKIQSIPEGKTDLEQNTNTAEILPENSNATTNNDSEGISDKILEELGFSEVSIHENKQLRELVVNKIHQLEELQNSTGDNTVNKIESAESNYPSPWLEGLSASGKSNEIEAFPEQNIENPKEQIASDASSKVSGEPQIINDVKIAESAVEATENKFQQDQVEMPSVKEILSQKSFQENNSRNISLENEVVKETESNQQFATIEKSVETELKFSNTEKGDFENIQLKQNDSQTNELPTNMNVSEKVEVEVSESTNIEKENQTLQNSFTNESVGKELQYSEKVESQVDIEHNVTADKLNVDQKNMANLDSSEKVEQNELNTQNVEKNSIEEKEPMEFLPKEDVAVKNELSEAKVTEKTTDNSTVSSTETVSKTAVASEQNIRTETTTSINVETTQNTESQVSENSKINTTINEESVSKESVDSGELSIDNRVVEENVQSENIERNIEVDEVQLKESTEPVVKQNQTEQTTINSDKEEKTIETQNLAGKQEEVKEKSDDSSQEIVADKNIAEESKQRFKENPEIQDSKINTLNKNIGKENVQPLKTKVEESITSTEKSEITAEVSTTLTDKTVNTKSNTNEIKTENQYVKAVESEKGESGASEDSSFSENSDSFQNEQKTLYNNHESEKKSSVLESFDEKLVEQESDKLDKINPLQEVDANKKIEVQQTENKTFSTVDLKEVIYKIERMISNAAINRINNPSFTIDAKELGKMEIKVKQENKEEQGVILVENNDIKQELEKHIPDIQENLQQKGVSISAINVEVNSGNENSAGRKKFTNKQNKKIGDVTSHQVSTVETRTIKTKSYGYNTMEVLA